MKRISWGNLTVYLNVFTFKDVDPDDPAMRLLLSMGVEIDGVVKSVGRLKREKSCIIFTLKVLRHNTYLHIQQFGQLCMVSNILHFIKHCVWSAHSGDKTTLNSLLFDCIFEDSFPSYEFIIAFQDYNIIFKERVW